MKRNLLLIALLSLGLVTGLVSCSKDDASLNNGSQIFTIKTLFDGLRSAPQTFTVTAGQTQVITGARGTKITFYPQSFKNANGTPITSGTIKIELIEAYKPSEMIANRVVTTTTDSKLLTSGGSVNIKATMDAKEVMATAYGIAFKQDAHSENPMALFYGVPYTDTTGTTTVWGEDTSGTVDRTIKDSIGQNFYYAFDTCINFNWINCDYFYSTPGQRTDISVIAPDSSYNLFNTQIYIIFPAINAVTGMWSYSAASHKFTLGSVGYYIPVGASVHIVVIGSKNNSYFMDVHQNVVVTNNMSLSFTPTPQSLSAIQAVLSSL